MGFGIVRARVEFGYKVNLSRYEKIGREKSVTQTIPGGLQKPEHVGREMCEVVSLQQMVSEVSYRSEECVSGRLFLTLPKYALSVQLGFNQVREAG